MLISAQGSKPNFGIVQDCLLGAYKMTVGIQKIKQQHFNDISLKTNLSISQIQNRIQIIRRVFKTKKGKAQCFHGKGLISLILPQDFEFELTNKADPQEPVVRIHRGVLYEGALDKKCLGAVANGIIHKLYKQYGTDTAINFIDNIQFITNNWLLTVGFSIGIADCLIQGQEKVEEITDVVKKCYIEAEGIKTTTSHPLIRETRIMGVLGKARDIGLKIAKDALAQDNHLKDTVVSGSKGDYFNIAQITGLLGQQNIMGKRAQKTLTNGKRTLPHYPLQDLTTEMEYESRGFIASSFIKGLNPREFYFHMMSGREGVCDTATNTARSGYMTRRILKLCEDIKTQYDGTVRDTNGNIYQLAYGGVGADPLNLVKVQGQQQFCNVFDIVKRLNTNFEVKNKLI